MGSSFIIGLDFQTVSHIRGEAAAEMTLGKASWGDKIEKTIEHGAATAGNYHIPRGSPDARIRLGDVVLSAFTPDQNRDKVGERSRSSDGVQD